MSIDIEKIISYIKKYGSKLLTIKLLIIVIPLVFLPKFSIYMFNNGILDYYNLPISYIDLNEHSIILSRYHILSIMLTYLIVYVPIVWFILSAISWGVEKFLEDQGEDNKEEGEVFILILLFFLLTMPFLFWEQGTSSLLVFFGVLSVMIPVVLLLLYGMCVRYLSIMGIIVFGHIVLLSSSHLLIHWGFEYAKNSKNGIRFQVITIEKEKQEKEYIIFGYNKNLIVTKELLDENALGKKIYLLEEAQLSGKHIEYRKISDLKVR